jgi:phage terminase large subunit-like protein
MSRARRGKRRESNRLAQEDLDAPPSALAARAICWEAAPDPPSLRRLRFRTGAEAALFSGASPEQLRGPDHHLAWCDELAKWEKPQETWDMLQFGLRLGDLPRVIITTTPRPGPVLRGIMDDPATIVTGGPSRANPHNSPAWRRSIHTRYAGTRLGRQELDGEVLSDAPGALWTVELLERCRSKSPSPPGEGYGVGPVVAPHDPAHPEEGPSPAKAHLEGEAVRVERSRDTRSSEAETCNNPAHPEEPVSLSNRRLEGPPNPPPSRGRACPPPFARIVIGVDPPSGDGTCGIIACARDGEGRAHILADHSVTARRPEGWARAVADAVRIWSEPLTLSLSKGAEGERGEGAPALVVAEQNQGGKMVAAVLRTADPNLRVKSVTATVGKAERAAPVAMLFEAGKVVLHGRFPELEAELLGMIAGGDYEGPGTSPDRADAMVWALTELMLGPERRTPRVRTL